MTEFSFRADQDPEAKLDWTLDWSKWLGDGETIIDATWTASNAELVTLSDDAFGTTSTTVFVADLVPGQKVDITCHITTSNSPAREDDRTIRFTTRNF